TVQLTAHQRGIVGAIAVGHLTVTDIAHALNTNAHTTKNRLRSLGARAGIQGTANQIVNQIVQDLASGTGIAQGLNLTTLPQPANRPPYTPTDEDLTLLGAIYIGHLTGTDIARALNTNAHTTKNRLQSLGARAGIQGTANQIVNQIVQDLASGTGIAQGLNLTTLPHPQPANRPPYTPTDEDLTLLGAINIGHLTATHIAHALNTNAHTTKSRLESLGFRAGIQGTANQIVNQIVQDLASGTGIAQGLNLTTLPHPQPANRPPYTPTDEDLTLLGAIYIGNLTGTDIAHALNITVPTTHHRLGSLGARAGIQGTANQIVNQIVQDLASGTGIAQGLNLTTLPHPDITPSVPKRRRTEQ
ncbi:hypothetical protein ABZ069_37890, partial [Streptomyces microflavus]|uniref:hypothetical protein n=1 Tax=Streptomyces microflavus TaxID=1919 RepID=UPI0033BD721E